VFVVGDQGLYIQVRAGVDRQGATTATLAVYREPILLKVHILGGQVRRFVVPEAH
jgi:hypothetical protein